MKYHIVRNNETLEDILLLYQISKKELKEVNKHIKSFERLVPGSRINIPAITEADDDEILAMEPFIEDYYPKTPKEVLNDGSDYENVIKVTSQESDLSNNNGENNIEENNNEEHNIKEQNNKNNKTLEDGKINPYSKIDKRKIDYYPYYYYDPLTGRYFVYYYPYAYRK